MRSFLVLSQLGQLGPLGQGARPWSERCWQLPSIVRTGHHRQHANQLCMRRATA